MDDLAKRAREFALRKHEGQRKRKSGAPYHEHLEAVAAILTAHDYTGPLVQAAAYLHDTLEKTDTTLGELQAEFGFEVAELVYWLSDLERGPASSRTTMSAMRLSRAPLPAKLIKLADIIDNVATARDHDRAALPGFLSEKRELLQRMLTGEGAKLSDLPLFRLALQSVS